MQRFSVIFALFCGIVAIQAVPVVRPLPPTKPENYTKPMDYPDFVNPVFDIKFTEEQIKAKSGLPDERYRWRNGFIVHPDRAFTQSEYAVINDALYELSTHLCIQILMWPQDSNPTGDYVEIMRGGADSGCWSYLGRLGGRQELNLQYNGCIHKYIVIHESIHALGYDHEQCRTDRDDYVNVLYENIIPEYRFAFDITAGSTTFGVPYDTASIMQYASTSFSSNGQSTIVTKSGAQIPTNTVLTGNDIAKLQHELKAEEKRLTARLGAVNEAMKLKNGSATFSRPWATGADSTTASPVTTSAGQASIPNVPVSNQGALQMQPSGGGLTFNVSGNNNNVNIRF